MCVINAELILETKFKIKKNINSHSRLLTNTSVTKHSKKVVKINNSKMSVQLNNIESVSLLLSLSLSLGA